VAAGGGSKLFFRSGMFVVGPESAGAHPGPVCYKKGMLICYVHGANHALYMVINYIGCWTY
jgi:N-methylhydantoinase A/oxoprolinase/acetone carboxylase beta subunit